MRQIGDYAVVDGHELSDEMINNVRALQREQMLLLGVKDPDAARLSTKKIWVGIDGPYDEYAPGRDPRTVLGWTSELELIGERGLSENDVLVLAIKVYGEALQKDQLIEECAELITAIRHERRGRPSKVVEEMVDVEILIDQMKKVVDQKEWDAMREYKIRRLEERMSVGLAKDCLDHKQRSTEG